MRKKILRSGLIAMLLLTVLLSFAYAGETAKKKELKKAEELYNKIEVLYSEKDYGKKGYADKMIKECRKLIKKYPHTEYATKAQYKIAEIQRDCGNYLDAIKEYEKAIIDYPKNERVAEAQYYIGELYERLDFARAIEAYEKVISNYPESEYAAKAQFNIGRVHDREFEYNQAIREYLKAITNYPNSEYIPGARERISACIKRLSISDLDKFIEDNPKSEFIAQAESRILDFMHCEQIAELYKFIKGNPKSRYADKSQFRIGELYEVRRIYRLAIEEYLKVITNYPNSEYVLEVRKRIPSIINTKLSLSDLDKFIEDNPKSEFIAQAKARISYVEKKEREEAKAREEAERARARRIESELIASAKEYRRVNDIRKRLEYELKYKTPSYEYEKKQREYIDFCEKNKHIVRNYIDAAKEYRNIYGVMGLRDFAIEHDFLDVLPPEYQ